MSCGGLSEIKSADAEIQAIADKVKTEVETKSGKTFTSEYVATKYATQVVAGTNYFIKIHVGSNTYVHARVYKTLPHAGETLEVTGVQTDKSEADPLVYF